MPLSVPISEELLELQPKVFSVEQYIGRETSYPYNFPDSSSFTTYSSSRSPTSSDSSKKISKKRKTEQRICPMCLTTETPQWRRFKPTMEMYCK